MMSVVLIYSLASRTADASVGQGYISGWDRLDDDWGDEGTLARNTFPYSSATGLWQMVLEADGYLSISDIDCEFGPTTEAATKSWQRARNLSADGRVGPQTFSVADNRIRQTSDPQVVYYQGSRYNAYFGRVNGRYEIFPGHIAYYTQKSPAC